MYLKISDTLKLATDALEFKAIRSSGPGGQNVNKVSSAIQMRFDIRNSSLPDIYKRKVLNFNDQRIGSDGIIVIKAYEFRTQEQNRQAAKNRLVKLLQQATYTRPRRIPTKPTKSSKIKRLEKKTHRGNIKGMRGKIDF